MTRAERAAAYRRYIDCLNRQDRAHLDRHVGANVEHNDRRLGVHGHRAMRERDHREIPDLRFDIGLLVCEPPHVAARLRFDCAPVGSFLGLSVNGRTVRFAENVFYRYDDGRISAVCRSSTRPRSSDRSIVDVHRPGSARDAGKGRLTDTGPRRPLSRLRFRFTFEAARKLRFDLAGSCL